jgi:hypothetical protein
MLELIVEGTRAGEQHSSRTTEDISESDWHYWIDTDQQVSLAHYKRVADMVEGMYKFLLNFHAVLTVHSHPQ